MHLTRKNIILAIILGIASIHPALTNDFDLPDLGTPSDSVLSPVKEKEIRDSIINQIYGYDLVMLDPIIYNYIEQLGFKLALNSENPKAPFDFFVVAEDLVNASTYPGGLIIMYSGLILKTETESELAGVMAHEIAHATQRHMSRFYANSKKNTIPMLLGLVGALAASRYSDSRDAPVAIVTAATALQQQSMINFTRSHEYEADRVGIETLNKSGFNPLGMAGFFEKLMREAPSDEKYRLPEYLRTHPLSVNRVTEAKNRANSMGVNDYKESEVYGFVKERIRVLTKNADVDNASYYKRLFKNKPKNEITQAEIYGYAFSLHQSHENKKAHKALSKIQASVETSLMISILKANIESELSIKKGIKAFEKLYDYYSESKMVIEPYIQALLKSKEYKNHKKARHLARQLVEMYPEQPNYYQLLAITNQNLGKSIEANEALAIKEHKIHNNYRAVRVLKNILKDDLNYYQRARIESKITKYENLITKQERQRELQKDRTRRGGG